VSAGQLARLAERDAKRDMRAQGFDPRTIRVIKEL
jgi:hypothetical protein